jgi:SEL1 protein
MYKLAVNPDETVDEPPPVHFGDMRQRLECDYVANIVARPSGGVVGLGSHWYLILRVVLVMC